MAWAHRYYGSDASVHLGSGRYKHSGGSKSSSSSTENTIAQCLARRINEEWSKWPLDADLLKNPSPFDSAEKGAAAAGGRILEVIQRGLKKPARKSTSSTCQKAWSLLH